MRATALILLLLGACAGDDSSEDPHKLGTCDNAWGTVTACEAACHDGPTNATGLDMQCRVGTNPGTGQPEYCPAANSRDGGCCEVVQNYVRFYDCAGP